MSKRKKVLFGLLGLILALVLWDIWAFHYEIPDGEPAYASTSPDGRFTVSVYHNYGILPIPYWIHPRGRAGTVVLRENKTGKVLQRVTVDYMNAGTETPHVRWNAGNRFPPSVSVVGVDVWDLPPPEPAK